MRLWVIWLVLTLNTNNLGIFKLFFKRSKQKPYIQGQSEESKRKDKLWSTKHFITMAKRKRRKGPTTIYKTYT
jgi:ADP-heptose:LPS heptosyltransferase